MFHCMSAGTCRREHWLLGTHTQKLIITPVTCTHIHVCHTHTLAAVMSWSFWSCLQRPAVWVWLGCCLWCEGRNRVVHGGHEDGGHDPGALQRAPTEQGLVVRAYISNWNTLPLEDQPEPSSSQKHHLLGFDWEEMWHPRLWIPMWIRFIHLHDHVNQNVLIFRLEM